MSSTGKEWLHIQHTAALLKGRESQAHSPNSAQPRQELHTNEECNTTHLMHLNGYSHGVKIMQYAP
jgi:hypothetical protein